LNNFDENVIENLTIRLRQIYSHLKKHGKNLPTDCSWVEVEPEPSKILQDQQE